jgi:flagellar biosynthetic protein FlhB
MSDNRTEKATPKKREDARKRGQVARRPELAASVAFLAILVMVQATGESLTARARSVFTTFLARAASDEPLTAPALHGLFAEAMLNIAALSLPIVAAGLAAGLAANFAQGGWTLSAGALKPKTERFNPAANLKRVFGTTAPIELLKVLVKLSLLVGVCYPTLARAVAGAPGLIGTPAPRAFAEAASLAYDLCIRAGGAMAFAALLDYGLGWYQHEKSLRMSKQEIRDEFRQQEGDPLIKSQRRRAARALLRNKVAVEVPKADVVVTNPTHFAVALKYDHERHSAPVVVAKGADAMALRIRKIAKEHNVAVVENPPLARSLYRTVETGRAIPPELFRAVAEVLAYVFRQNERAAQR